MTQSLNYGMIGNGRMSALVSSDGSIDWSCMPYFDSPSVFAAILDTEKGGRFALEPQGIYGTEQQYLKNTVILETRFFSRQGGFNLIDYVPRYARIDDEYAPIEIHRLIEVTKGEPQVIIRYEPRFNYAQGETELSIEDNVIVASQGEEKLYLYSNIDAHAILKGDVLSLPQGTYFVLSYQTPLESVNYNNTLDTFRRTTRYWRTWTKHCYLPPDFQNEIIRSALTLKMLVYEETGAVIAAPTTSIPEIFEGNRNWDYRYCWLRDSFFIVNALMKISHFEELEGFINYIKMILGEKITQEKGLEYLRPLYNINGKTVPEETQLDHLSGFNNSRPIRIGNNATTHFQNDIYGELVQSLHPMFFDQRIVREDMEQLWIMIGQLVELAIEKFAEEDNGIWEFRNTRRHYTFSKLMCWVAVDRGIRIARHLSKPEVKRWNRIRNWMRIDILNNAWNPQIQAFTQSYGSIHLDASTLLMPTFGFISAQDPRMKSTITQSEQRLMKNGFVFRYTNPDDFGAPQNAFIICTFWLIDALVLAGEGKKAMIYFENVLRFSNHLGLFSEDIETKTGALTGNFPQGYTHVAIINTAMKLNNHNLYFT
jgi:alpha,alpha-trehalase